MRISDWSSDVCSSDLDRLPIRAAATKPCKACSGRRRMRGIPVGSVDLNSRQACEKVAFPANSMRLSFFPLKTTQEWSMSIYTALLFQQGYIQNTELALSLAADDVGERNDATPPPDAAGGERDADCGRPPRPFRRGAIASLQIGHAACRERVWT